VTARVGAVEALGGDTIARLAELVVVFGANVQPGQIVSVRGQLGHEELVRAIGESAYRHGAKFVDAGYFDPWVKRARLLYAAEDTLSFVPAWYGEQLRSLAGARGARISLTGPVELHVFDDIDPERAGKDQLPFVKEVIETIGERTINWTVAPCPTRGWAEAIFPELEPDAALERLWHEVQHVLRLDESDPVASWRARLETLGSAAETLTERRFDAIHFTGPGTDLTVGLFPSSEWTSAADFTTADGIEHVPNLPTEEIFTAPDPERVDGIVRATKPLDLNGAVVEEFTIRFEAGRAVAIEAAGGADALRGRTATDEGAARLGEIALVDGESRIGRLDTVFKETLLDENAASHLAFGGSFPFCVDEDDRLRVNRSAIHVDFMIGGDQVDVTGVTRQGELVPVLRGGAWQI
jgi:aminopeptidase